MELALAIMWIPIYLTIGVVVVGATKRLSGTGDWAFFMDEPILAGIAVVGWPWVAFFWAIMAALSGLGRLAGRL